MEYQFFTELLNEDKISYLKNCNKDFSQNLMKISNINDTINKIIKYSNFIVINKNLNDFTQGGYIAFYDNDLVSKQAYITLICVSEKEQKKGLGKKLLEKCFEICKNKGFEKVKLEVNSENENAIRFYKKNGFVFCSEASENSQYMIKNL